MAAEDAANTSASVAARTQLDYVASALRERGVELHIPSPLEPVSSRVLGSGTNLTVLFKRDDLISPLFPGNKFRKLVPHLYRLLQQAETPVVTFGGAYSNHLYAFASAVSIFGFRGIAVVRGERIEPLNPILAYAERCGVQLHFASRETYRQKDSQAFRDGLAERFGDYYLVPEGGTEQGAVESVAHVAEEITEPIDQVVVAVGTGGTLAGLARGFDNRARVIGVCVLKGAQYLNGVVASLVGHDRNWTMDHDHHYGGFARVTHEMYAFLDAFEAETSIEIDPVYTAKALLGLRDLAATGRITGSTLFVHTGGVPIQTRDALRKRR